MVGARIPAAFWLLALINLLVGGMVALERTVVPLMGRDLFGLPQGGALAAFIVSFGIAKALFNLVAGAWADRIGWRRLLLPGMLPQAAGLVLLATTASFAGLLVAAVGVAGPTGVVAAVGVGIALATLAVWNEV